MTESFILAFNTMFLTTKSPLRNHNKNYKQPHFPMLFCSQTQVIKAILKISDTKNKSGFDLV